MEKICNIFHFYRKVNQQMLRKLTIEMNIKKYNRNLLNSNCNIKIMEVSQNNESSYFNLINAAVFHSVGRYFFFLAYDDYLSTNYAEDMIRLFENNDKCVTAAPLPVSVDRFGNSNIEISRIFFQNNKRKTYTNGCELALSFINGDGAVSAPGGLFAYKTEIIINPDWVNYLKTNAKLLKDFCYWNLAIFLQKLIKYHLEIMNFKI
jgi:hypothetical protein